MKENVSILSGPLSHIIHLIFKEGRYPEFRITAVHKKNDTHLCHYSTEHTLISLIEAIKRDLCSGFYVCGIFVGKSVKAFYMVDYEILPTKLLFYGVRGLVDIWFLSFLTQRKQYVSISGFLSDTRIVQCGVAQGSALGPLQFLFYINDQLNIELSITSLTVLNFYMLTAISKILNR